MVQKYGVDPEFAGLIPSLLPLGTLFLTPLFGYVYDRIGKGATIMIIGAFMLICVHAVFAIPFINNWVVAVVLTIILGIAFSLVPSAMWPSVPKIIPEAVGNRLLSDLLGAELGIDGSAFADWHRT